MVAVMMTDTTRTLVARLAGLLRREHDAMADFLVERAEFDRLKGWRALGHAGLFPFLHRELGLSKSAAFFRMRAAQLIQQFPEIIQPLRDGRLCISTEAELGKVITPENKPEVLSRFFHRSKQEAKIVSAELAPMPHPPVTAVVTTVHPVQQPSARPETLVLETSSQTVSLGELAPAESPSPGAPEPEAGLDLLLARDAKKKRLVAHPRPRKPANEPPLDSRHVPAEVRRAVWERDQGRCQWPLEGGGVCGSQYKVEFDHITPWAQGGPTTKENGRLLCGPHNDHACRLAYGDAFVERVRRWRMQRARKRSSTAG